MTHTLGERLRLTVLGCSTAAPHPATPTAGFLVEWESTAILLDCGQGVIRNLQRVLDPHQLSAIVIGHMHADHYLDIVGLRYLYPWGERAPDPLPIYLPPGGRPRLDALATAVSERAGFFDAAFDAIEYDPGRELKVGDLRLRFVQGRHYVPAWGVVIDAPDGTRLAYTGDTGPSASVEDGVRGADLLLVESALGLAAHDDPERGHLTPEEAIDLARRAEARSAILVHYGPSRKPQMDAMCAAAGPWVRTAVDGLTVTVRSGAARGRRPADARPSVAATSAPKLEGASG
ncbi:MAG TPA: MBL fold metallo-hydrolase [Candidatus Limnocylindrales bacterium]|jgi:ribonuclease BN (tRNA processing enzyme)|nr:MBL fold metallo-hydrolase [Candidatus Limnocylindrales bacterium]